MKVIYNTSDDTAILQMDDRKINAEAIPDLLFLAESIIEKGVKGQNTHTAREVLLQIATRAMEKAAVV
jgi:hypothetical protein